MLWDWGGWWGRVSLIGWGRDAFMRVASYRTFISRRKVIDSIHSHPVEWDESGQKRWRKMCCECCSALQCSALQLVVAVSELSPSSPELSGWSTPNLTCLVWVNPPKKGTRARFQRPVF
jgi:hypothetical protein